MLVDFSAFFLIEVIAALASVVMAIATALLTSAKLL